MFVIITVFSLAYILYKTGVINKFVDACKLEENPQPAPATVPNIPAAPPQLTVYEIEQKTRMQLESDARYILTQQRYKNPDTVCYMGDEMLTHIIREYLDI